MAIFTIEINNQSQLNGITAARHAYNNSLPATIINESGDEISNPNLLGSDAAYIQFVMSKAAESYAKQYGV